MSDSLRVWMAETDRSGFPRRRRYFLLFFVSLREMQGWRITSLHLSQGRKKSRKYRAQKIRREKTETNCRNLPGWESGIPKPFFDERLHVRLVIGLDEGLHPGLIFVSRTDDENIGVSGPLGALNENTLLRDRETGWAGIGAVHGGGCHIRQSARQLRSLNFDKLQLLRVRDNINRSRFIADAGTQLNETCGLEKKQGTAAVRRIIRNRHAGAFGTFFRLFSF